MPGFRRTSFVISIALFMVAPSTAFAIDEFNVPTASSQPSGIAVGPDGAIWFTEENSSGTPKAKIGRLDPAGAAPGTSNGFTEYSIPTDFASPSKIVAGPDGALWFTEFAVNKIGRLDPSLANPGTTDGITEYPPGALATGSNPDGMTVGPDGAIWFTEFGGNKIGRITTSGVITEYGPLVSGSHPSDIALGPDGRLWFTIESGELGALDPAAAVPGTAQGISEYPRTGTDPSGIASSCATLWFTMRNTSKVEQTSTNGAKLNEFPTNPGIAFGGPSGITFGSDGALWFTEADASKIGRLTTGGSFIDFTIPTPASEPSDIVARGPELWFTELSGNKIGRIASGSGTGPNCGGGGGGGGGGGSMPPPVTSTGKPSVQSLSVSPRSFKAAKKGPSIAAKVGAKVTYRLSMAASTKFTVQRETAGRKKGKKCVKETRRNRKGKKCKLYKAVRGSFTHSGKAGTNTFKFTGRVGGKSLKPGRYQLTAVATAGSNKSTLKKASFKIVR
jgi:virginiamycin B lyase